MSPSIGSAARRGGVPGPPSDRVKARLLRLYEALRGRFGRQGWWPGRAPSAAGRPVPVANVHVRRVLARHRLVGTQATKEELRAWLEAHLPSDPVLFNELHALVVAVAKSNCRSTPRCEGCVLRFDLRGRRPAPYRPD
jgi:endonuclease III-like uncharacterized protein